jgi:large repetitive protein
VVEDFNIGIPNLFSPNGDGINDVWRIFNLENYPISVQIFSRWGNKVWENTNYQNDWNGTSQDGNELTDGTYFYVIEITGTDKVLKGDVNILR